MKVRLGTLTKYDHGEFRDVLYEHVDGVIHPTEFKLQKVVPPGHDKRGNFYNEWLIWEGKECLCRCDTSHQCMTLLKRLMT